MILKHNTSRHLPPLATALLLMLCGTVVGCGVRRQGPLVVESDVQYPAWVLGGTGVHASGGQRTLIGVGQIDGMRNVALARATADNRARAELARVLEAYFAALLADVEAGDKRGEDLGSVPEADANDRLPPSAKPAFGETRGARAHVSLERDAALVKSLLAASLPSVQVADHWFHPDRGAVFSEARLDVEEIRDGVARLRDVPEAMVSLLLARLEPVHEGMLVARGGPQSTGKGAPPASGVVVPVPAPLPASPQPAPQAPNSSSAVPSASPVLSP